MKTTAIHNPGISEQISNRPAMIITGILVAVVCALTLLYGNVTLGITSHLNEASSLPRVLTSKAALLNCFSTVWHF